jgi:3-O-methylgallate 3,4-dioxygenase
LARLVAAFGTSHSTMLLSSEEHWIEMFDRVDGRAPIHDFAGVRRSFDWLLDHLPADASERVAPAAIAARHRATMAALDRLEADIAAAGLDALIVVGDDQRELFQDAFRPAVAVHYGETIRNAAAPADKPDDWYDRDQLRRLEDGKDAHYPVRSDLALHLVRGLTGDGFDIAAIRELESDRFEGHAFSFVHRRLMRNGPIPIVPVFLNTYYPPNQPTPRRCFDLGARLRALVDSFPADLRVGILASGGLSHFLVNEPLDRMIIAALRDGDLSPVLSLPLAQLESGTSEVRNWICTAAAARDLALDWIEYVPAYRSRALTGVGLCFACWR